MIRTVWGKNRALRCAEIVTEVLHNATDLSSTLRGQCKPTTAVGRQGKAPSARSNTNFEGPRRRTKRIKEFIRGVVCSIDPCALRAVQAKKTTTKTLLCWRRRHNKGHSQVVLDMGSRRDQRIAARLSASRLHWVQDRQRKEQQSARSSTSSTST